MSLITLTRIAITMTVHQHRRHIGRKIGKLVRVKTQTKTIAINICSVIYRNWANSFHFNSTLNEIALFSLGPKTVWDQRHNLTILDFILCIEWIPTEYITISAQVMKAHLTLVNWNGPGQFEWQLLSAQVQPSWGFKHPALSLHYLNSPTEKPHSGKSFGKRGLQIIIKKKNHNICLSSEMCCSFRTSQVQKLINICIKTVGLYFFPNRFSMVLQFNNYTLKCLRVTTLQHPILIGEKKIWNIILDIYTDMDCLMRFEQNYATWFDGNENYKQRGLNLKTPHKCKWK